MSKNTSITKAPSQAIIQALRDEFPVEQGYSAAIPPRLGMYSQDVTEKVKNKKTGKPEINVISEAGTFFTDKRTDEKDENGKDVWEKNELGTSIEGIILFQRKQLRHYNESTEEFISSPIYDTEDDVIPLFLNKKEIARGTPKELKALPQFQVVKDGKTKSSLDDNRILYVLYEEEVYQFNLRGSSMWSYNDYKKGVIPPAVVTEFTSEAMEKGDISWNKIIFTAKRELSENEIVELVQPQIESIKEAIAAQKEYFANRSTDTDTSEEATKAKKGFEKF